MGKTAVICADISVESAGRLAEILNVDCYNVTLEPFDADKYDHIINYGTSNPVFGLNHQKYLNKPEAVEICKNKISTIKRLVGKCNVVEYTKSREKAEVWMKQDGVVVARALQEGSQGRGISYCRTQQELDNAEAKFWAKAVFHDAEVRINVFKGKILSVFKKEEVNGFIEFVHLPIVGESPQVTKMIEAIQEGIGIDFYGMDVVVNDQGECTLLEVNSGAILQPEAEKALVGMIKKELR
jgi:hypothetical protein